MKSLEVGVHDMCSTCYYALNMTKMIQIRNVPDELHGKLKARAAIEGMSLSDYLLADLERSAAKPTLREIRDRLRQRSSVRPGLSPAEAVRFEREGR